MQILTVGQSDHAQDAGEPAAGGGTQSSGQDLRATMLRKGEPCGGPVSPPKLSPSFSGAPFLGSTAFLCLFQPLQTLGGAHLGTHEKLRQGLLKAMLRERSMN